MAKFDMNILFIKQEVGMPADYVNKLARMFQDIKVSEDLNQEFKDAHRNNNEYIAGNTTKSRTVAVSNIQ